VAVAFDAKTATATSATPGTTLTITNLTVGSGSNRAMALLIMWQSGSVPPVTTCQWDDAGTPQAMTLVTGTNSANGSSSMATSIYGLVAPTSGNKNLKVSWTGSFEAHAVAISFTGVDQTSVAVAFPHGVAVNKTTSTASPASTGAITSATGNMVISGFGDNSATHSGLSGTTIVIDDSGPNFGVAFSYNNGAATVTQTCNLSTSATWAAFGCDILAASSSITPVPNIGWVEPVRSKAPGISALTATANYVPFIRDEANVASRWYRQWADPVRKPPPTRSQPEQSIGYPPIIPSFGWFNNLSTPTLPKGLKAALQPSFSFDPQPFIVSYSWFGGLRDPVRRVPQAIRYEQQSWSLFVEPTVVSFGWFANLSDPVRTKPGLTAATQPPYFYLAPFPITVDIGWFGPLRDPYRPITQPTGMRVRYPFVASSVSISWFNSLSDPVRRRPTATRYEQQSWSLFVEPTAVSIGWFGPLSDPTRRPTRPTPDEYPGFPPIVSFSWFGNLSEPVRLPAGLKAAQQAFFSFSPFPITASFGWFNNLSDPVRKPPIATRYEQQTWSLFVEPTVVTFGWFNPFGDPVRRITRPIPDEYPGFPPRVSFSWFGNLSEPVRAKPRVKWLDEQSFQFPFVPNPGSWFSPWREPTPPKRRAAFFQPLTFTLTPPITPSFGWYGSLSLPVRKKPKVWEGQYQAWNPATIQFVYLAYMRAYETRDFLSAVLYAFNPPIHALVDIIEKDPRYRGNMGIIENIPQPSILASVVTPQTIPATGTPVAAVRARIAIIVS
jgi:hypothetical protein